MVYHVISKILHEFSSSVDREYFLESTIACGGLNIRVLKPLGYGVYVDPHLFYDSMKDYALRVRSTNEYEYPIIFYPEISMRARDNRVEDLCMILNEFTHSSSELIVVTRLVDIRDDLKFRKVGVRAVYSSIPYDEIVNKFRDLLLKVTPSLGAKTGLLKLTLSIAKRAGKGGLVIARMPTGYGKTTALNLLARILSSHGLGGYGLLIAPLRAIMREQASKSRVLGLKIEFIDSSVKHDVRRSILERTSKGLVDVLTVTPERFLDDSFRRFIEENPPSFIAIDEAHVAIEWSFFRPSYTFLLSYLREARRKSLRRVPIIAVSATLTRAHSRLLALRLGFNTIREIDLESDDDNGAYPAVFLNGDVLRQNIRFDVVIAPFNETRLDLLHAELSRLSEWCKSREKSCIGIIYTGFIDKAPVEWLNARVIADYLSRRMQTPILLYHGRIGRKMKRELVEIFPAIEGREFVIVSTKALGMGVNLREVKWVVHYTPSDSIEDLYQEVGRAGREGGEAYSIILYNPMDFELKRRLIYKDVLPITVPLRIYNTIVELASRKIFENNNVVIPLRLAGSISRTIRGLDKLQESNLIDYTVSRKLGDYLTPYGGHLRFYTCRSKPGEAYPLKMETKTSIVEIGYCNEWDPVDIDFYAIVEVKKSLGRLRYPTLELLLSVFTETAWKLSKLDELQNMLEDSLTERRSIYDLLKEYFERRVQLNVRECKELLRESVGVHRFRDIDHLLLLVKNLQYCLSSKGLTITSRKKSLLTSILESLRLKYRVKDTPSIAHISRIEKASKEPIKLARYGFIIVIAEDEEVLRRVLNILQDYPFKALIYFRR